MSAGEAMVATRTPTQLVVYPDEGHRFVSEAHNRDLLQRTVRWFDTYLKPRGI